MAPDKNQLTAIQNYLLGKASEADHRLVNDWYYSQPDNTIEIPINEPAIKEQIKQRIKDRLCDTLKIPIEIPKTPIPIWRQLVWQASAAAVLAIALISYFFVVRSKEKTTNPITKQVLKNDVLPGSKSGTLILDDGTAITLDTVKNGFLAAQGNTNINNNNGALIYNGASDGKIRYNTLITKKGELFPLTLSDGTHILVDAATSIRFPVAFIGNTREVEINGRAWFEVAKNTHKAFYVVKGDKKILVHGTSFDVNAFENEAAIKVTLVEGSVQVFNGSGSSFIKPGQQAILEKNNIGITLIDDVDIEETIAWMKGKISFHNADINSILREIERWYDVEIEVVGRLPNKKFYFDVPRSINLSELLRVFEVNNINYKIDGEKKKLTLLP